MYRNNGYISHQGNTRFKPAGNRGKYIARVRLMFEKYDLMLNLKNIIKQKH